VVAALASIKTVVARGAAAWSGQILAAIRQAVAEGRSDVAEHLLCALEALDAGGTAGLSLSEAYLSMMDPTFRN
jgi:hypothetical protein